MQDAGSIAVDYGNNLRGYAEDAGFERAFAYPGLRTCLHPRPLL